MLSVLCLRSHDRRAAERAAFNKNFFWTRKSASRAEHRSKNSAAARTSLCCGSNFFTTILAIVFVNRRFQAVSFAAEQQEQEALEVLVVSHFFAGPEAGLVFLESVT